MGHRLSACPKGCTPLTASCGVSSSGEVASYCLHRIECSLFVPESMLESNSVGLSTGQERLGEIMDRSGNLFGSIICLNCYV